jgi:hypothetical protein
MSLECDVCEAKEVDGKIDHCNCGNCDCEESISWGELADLTHATQVERFNWCSCEEQEYFPYSDCPKEV